VAAVVRDPTEAGAAKLAELREYVERFPRQAALKRVAALRGAPVRSDVRPPLRDLGDEEAGRLEAWVASAGLVAA
jgi:dihydrodipicolinate synthase/N-acetylneuraminate lyase